MSVDVDLAGATHKGLDLLSNVLRSFDQSEAADVVDSLSEDAVGLVASMPTLATGTTDPHGAARAIFGLVEGGLRAGGLTVPAQILSLIQPLVGALLEHVYRVHLVADGMVVSADLT